MKAIESRDGVAAATARLRKSFAVGAAQFEVASGTAAPLGILFGGLGITILEYEAQGRAIWFDRLALASCLAGASRSLAPDTLASRLY